MLAPATARCYPPLLAMADDRKRFRPIDPDSLPSTSTPPRRRRAGSRSGSDSGCTAGMPRARARRPSWWICRRDAGGRLTSACGRARRLRALQRPQAVAVTVSFFCSESLDPDRWPTRRIGCSSCPSTPRTFVTHREAATADRGGGGRRSPRPPGLPFTSSHPQRIIPVPQGSPRDNQGFLRVRGPSTFLFTSVRGMSRCHERCFGLGVRSLARRHRRKRNTTRYGA